jgi:AcrR family transcriptional regulator
MARARRAQRANPYPRGEESRQRIVVSALEVFGRYGFDGASTRLLAREAKVNLAAIAYYFGGKEGLYRAVAEHVASQISERQAPVLERVEAALSDPSLDRERALALLLQLLDAFAAMIIASNGADRWARFIIREQMDPTPAFDILYGAVMRRVHGACAALVARLLDQDPEDPDTLIRTSTIIGQILVFRAARATALKRLGWARFTDERVRAIQAIVREQVRAILHRPEGTTP